MASMADLRQRLISDMRTDYVCPAGQRLRVVRIHADGTEEYIGEGFSTNDALELIEMQPQGGACYVVHPVMHDVYDVEW